MNLGPDGPSGRRPRAAATVLPAGVEERYPVLAADVAVLERELVPVFAEHDRRAVVAVRRYRAFQLVLIGGSVVVAGLGTLQAVLAGSRWPGLALAVLGVVLTACSQWVKEAAPQAAALGARVKAERLRALCFSYLSGRGNYAGADRERELRRAVLAIDAGREVA